MAPCSNLDGCRGYGQRIRLTPGEPERRMADRRPGDRNGGHSERLPGRIERVELPEVRPDIRGPSLSCSEWEGVGPPLYGHQAKALLREQRILHLVRNKAEL